MVIFAAKMVVFVSKINIIAVMMIIFAAMMNCFAVKVGWTTRNVPYTTPVIATSGNCIVYRRGWNSCGTFWHTTEVRKRASTSPVG